MSIDEKYMQRCLHLASLGKGNVAPNPLVGAVIVYQDRIIGEGFHRNYGEAHAEVNAVNSVEDQSLLSKSTIYVTLEPCAHFGKTPPCADLLVHHQFKKVVIGCMDTFSKVSGKGIERLMKAGIDVTIGILEKECRELNRHFFTYHEQKRPFIYLKWAQTPNGFIDNSSGKKGEVNWISAPETQVKTHLLRAEVQAILVGKNTVLQDNPALTVRAVNGKNPIRVVLDSNLSLPRNLTVFSTEAPTIVLNCTKSFEDENCLGIKLETLSAEKILEVLYEQSIQSVLIEGGKSTLETFINARLWDEAMVIVGQHSFEEGISAPTFHGIPARSESFFGDHIYYYTNR